MKRVYCDTGGYRAELSGLQSSGLIELVQFHYENRNRNIKVVAPPSKPAWAELNYSWSELTSLTWNDLGKQSEKFSEILHLVGANNKRDAKHLDSAYMGKCSAFITSDKGDICANADPIAQLLGIRVFHFHDDWGQFLEFCSNDI